MAPPSGLTTPSAPADRAAVAAAVQRLQALLAEVHFADRQKGVAATVARMLTPIVRWQSPATMQTPLTWISKSDSQVGATSLARIAHTAATGKLPTVTSLPSTDEEMEKVITTMVLHNPSAAWVMDNAPKGEAVEHSKLSLLMTSGGRWTGRILGKNQNADVAHCLTIDITGINIGFSDELGNRAVVIALDAPAAAMSDWRWQRPLNDLLDELTHQHAVRQALLTLVQAWLDAGQPPAPPKRPDRGLSGADRLRIGHLVARRSGTLGTPAAARSTAQTKPPSNGPPSSMLGQNYKRRGSSPADAPPRTCSRSSPATQHPGGSPAVTWTCPSSSPC